MDKPFFCVRYYLTHTCNLNCSFCDTHSEAYRSVKPLDAEDAVELLRQFHAAGCRYIDFTGGEPTLCPHLPLLLECAREMGIKTEVTSNGAAGMTPVLRACAALADKVNISLDTTNSERYTHMRGANRLETVIHTARELAELRRKAGQRPLRLMTVVTRENQADLPEVIRFAREIGAEVYLNPVFFYGRDIRPTETDCIEAIQQLTFERGTVVMLHFLEFYRDAARGKRPSAPCSANRQTLTVAPDGGVIVPCYHASEKTTLPWGGNLATVLQGEEFARHARDCGKLVSCQHCTVSPYHGISFSYVLDKYFLLQSYSERMAQFKRDFPDIHANCDSLRLSCHLDELFLILRSLPASPPEREGRLYHSSMYRGKIPTSGIDFSARDCWELEYVPHRIFDAVYQNIKRNVNECKELLRDVPEWMLRLWKLYVSVYMHASVCCDIPSEKAWMREHLVRLKKMCSGNEVLHIPEKLYELASW